MFCCFDCRFNILFMGNQTFFMDTYQFFVRIPSLITSTLSANFLGTGNYLKAIAMFTVTSILCITGIVIFYKISERGKNGK